MSFSPTPLPPLEFKKEAKRLGKHGIKLHSEEKEIEFKRCSHKNAKIVGNEVRCPCGASWTGQNLVRLLEFFTT